MGQVKHILLDLDGVLNSRYYIATCENFDTQELDPKAVARLNKITDATGAKLVISSSWRLSFPDNLINLRNHLISYGITGDIIGMTGYHYNPSDPYGGRAVEINLWLGTHQPDKFIILDDECISMDLDFFLIKTSVNVGLLDYHVDAAIKILND